MHFVEDENLSFAWGKALQLVSQKGQKEVAPLVVSIVGFGDDGRIREDGAVRGEVDALLYAEGAESVETTANTIFPHSLWNPRCDRAQLFERYSRVYPRIERASRKNSRGVYFRRMTTGGPDGHENQLDFVIDGYMARPGVRRGILQVAVFDPKRDHTMAARVGFPCMQHVTFAPTQNGLSVNSFYATQYIAKRAYGNYVGLCRLGRFVAHELGVPLTRVTCYAGVAELDVTKRAISPALRAVEAHLGSK